MKNLNKIVVVNKKRFFLVIIIFLAVIFGAVWGTLKFKNRNNQEKKKQVFEALVNIVDQKVSDPIEDARGSLKKGDVIAIFPEGHSWSETEKNSYLIIKLKIYQEDADKLLKAETKEVKNKNRKDGEQEEKDMMPEMEIVKARMYRLDLPDFDTQKFWGGGGQPFADKIFTSSIIEKK